MTSLAACESCHLPVRGLAKKNKKDGLLVIPIGVTAGWGDSQAVPPCVSQPRSSRGMLFCLVPKEWVGSKLP